MRGPGGAARRHCGAGAQVGAAGTQREGQAQGCLLLLLRECRYASGQLQARAVRCAAPHDVPTTLPPAYPRSWHFGAEAMCEYSRKEFEEGMAALACDSIDKLKAKLPGLRQELQVC